MYLRVMEFSKKKLIVTAFFLSLISLWALGMTLFNTWSLFFNYWHISLMMVFGSFIAGATTEGGGAVAFPILTLFFKVNPLIARDFPG